MMATDPPKYERVKNSIIQEIESNRYEIGEAFPSESQLLQEFDVSRPTLIRALRDLVQDGYLDRQQGRGTFVSARWKGKSAGRKFVPVFVSKAIAAKTGGDRFVQLQIFDGLQTGLTKLSNDRISYSIELHQVQPDESAIRVAEGLDTEIAFVVEPSFNFHLWDYLRSRGWQVWGLNEPIDGCASVYIDQERAGYLAARYLIGQGRRKLALLNGPKELYWGFAARERGFRRALEEADMEIDEGRLLEDVHALDSESGRFMFQQLRKRGSEVDGIVGATDLKAMGAMAAALEVGLHVPEDLLFVGIDNIAAVSCEPPLSSVAMPFFEIGSQAIFQAYTVPVKGTPAATPIQVCLQPTLVER